MMVVQDLADSLGLKNVRVICNRAEKLDERFDFMLGRAVSNLPNFLSFSSHLVDGKSKTPLTVVEQKSVSLGITVGSGLLYLKGTLSELFILYSNYQNHHLDQ
jgi:16S rRNA (guanine527-N7)-methyltransferase